MPLCPFVSFLSIQLPIPLSAQLPVPCLSSWLCNCCVSVICFGKADAMPWANSVPFALIWARASHNNPAPAPWNFRVCSRASFSHHGVRIGILEVDILPCKASGGVLTENDEVFVDDPEELVGQRVDYQLKIKTLKGLPSNYMSVYCKYRFQGDKEDFTTDMVRK